MALRDWATGLRTFLLDQMKQEGHQQATPTIGPRSGAGPHRHRLRPYPYLVSDSHGRSPLPEQVWAPAADGWRPHVSAGCQAAGCPSAGYVFFLDQFTVVARVVDRAKMEAVDPVPDVYGEDGLPAKVVAEEADVGARVVDARSHEGS